MTLRTRLFGTYVLIVIFCLMIVALATVALLRGYRDRLTMTGLDNIARPISVQIRSLATTSTTAENIWTSLEAQAERNNVYILLVGTGGKIIKQIPPTTSAELITLPANWAPKTITQAFGYREI